MAELRPYPFEALIHRMFRELETREAVFDLPARKFFLGEPGMDTGVEFHGHAASSPLGPAAGPQSQMAQNIVLSWLGGCRIMELKTVQIDDELHIDRPCIDMRTVGYNIEWSQELKLEQSLDEYVKGAMLVRMLTASADLRLEPGFDRVVYDMSVGYDLEGVRSEPVMQFVRGMRDATAAVDRLRREIPPRFGKLRDLDYETRLSDTVTLSTFHGCPPGEIERIIEFLLHEGLHCVVKFNPMLLGPVECRHLLHDVLGYTTTRVPDSAFERDAKWDQAVDMMDRLGRTAKRLGLGLGAKFTNTLIVENPGEFLPQGADEVYLSGPPLHVLAMHLVRRFRRTFGDRFPISFSAGIDRYNFPDAVALGLVPVTTCTDLLKTGGYGRLPGYYRELSKRMKAARAATIPDFIAGAFGNGRKGLDDLGLEPADPSRDEILRVIDGGEAAAGIGDPDLRARWISKLKVLNTEDYVDGLARDPRYARERNTTAPPKIGSHLELFDCVTCDKCIPVCPNDANFGFTPENTEIPVVKIRKMGCAWAWSRESSLTLAERHQIASFADFCNDCGNCDVFCPEDGGPYVVKPRFFGSEAAWRKWDKLDGFFMRREHGRDLVLGRIDGLEFSVEVAGSRVTFSGTGFSLSFREDDPEGTLTGDGPQEIDLTYYFIMDTLRRAVYDRSQINWINSLATER